MNYFIFLSTFFLLITNIVNANDKKEIFSWNEFYNVNLSMPNPDMKSFNIVSENDGFTNTDHHYTNGTLLEWSSFKKENNDIRRISHYIAMNMYTPQDIRKKTIQYDDRPYSGWLRYGIKHNKSYQNGMYILHDVSLGVIGPSALQKNFQNGWHELLGIGKAHGWQHQINDDLALQYRGQFGYDLFHKKENLSFVPYTNLEVGTVFSRAGGGFVLKFGDIPNINEQFGSGSFIKINDLDDHNFPSNTETQGITSKDFETWGMFFARFEANFVAYNAMIQGGLFNDASPHTTGVHNFITDFEVGITTMWPFRIFDKEPYTKVLPFLKNMQITYSVNIRSSESDIHDWKWDRHKWGNITLTWRY